MSTDLPEWLRVTLSSPRLNRYLAAADGDIQGTLSLYQCNLDLSAAFYGPIHWLEISLRNALHDTLRTKYGRDDWWKAAPLDDNGRRMVSAASSKVRRSSPRRAETCPDDVVAHLTFGFWVSLLSRGDNYDRNLWVPTLHHAFPNFSGPRRVLHRELNHMVGFRNRIMHHEPIFHYDLDSYRESIYRQLGYLSSLVADEVRPRDRIPEQIERLAEIRTTHGTQRRGGYDS